MRMFLSLIWSFILAGSICPSLASSSAVVDADDSTTGEHALAGQVVEAGSAMPLPGIHVVLVGTSRGTATDQDGRFRLTSVPAGKHLVRASGVGFATTERRVTTGPGAPDTLLIVLRPAVLEGPAVEVVAGWAMPPAPTPVSARRVTREALERLPGSARDVQRVMQAMPGVTLGDDHRNDLIVRGGAPAENRFLVDHIEVPNLSHFGTQGASGGGISVLEGTHIRAATFLTGGFPAEYGGRTSSVLDIELREGNTDRYAAAFDASMSGASVALEGPMGSAVPGSWLVAGRRSFLDLVESSLEMGAVPKYGSGLLKTVVHPTERDQLSVLAIAGADAIRFERGEESRSFLTDSDIETAGSLLIAGMTWRRTWAQSGVTRLTLSSVTSTTRTDRISSEGVQDFRNRSREGDYGLRLSSTWRTGRDGSLDAGGTVHRAAYRHALLWIGRSDTAIPITLDTAATAADDRAGAYLQYTHRFGERWDLTGGARYDYTGGLEHRHTVSPRLALRFQATRHLAFSWATGVYRQTPPPIWFTASRSARRLPRMRAVHYVGGLLWHVPSRWRLTTELFAKHYTHVPVFVDYPTMSTTNEGAEFGAFLVTGLDDTGTAHAEGVEVEVHHYGSGRYLLVASYTLSRARYRAYDGVERPTSFDIRHTVNLMLDARDLEVPLAGPLELSTRVRYAGGRPYTPFSGRKSRIVGEGIINPWLVNTERLPAYFRVDVRLTRRFDVAGSAVSIYIEAQNATDHHNVARRIYDRATDDVEEYLHWGRIFVGGISVSL